MPSQIAFAILKENRGHKNYIYHFGHVGHYKIIQNYRIPWNKHYDIVTQVKFKDHLENEYLSSRKWRINEYEFFWPSIYKSNVIIKGLPVLFENTSIK